VFEPNYELYRESVGITNSEMTTALRRVYPHYSKVVGTMINAPEKYGVCLLPKAEEYLTHTFGIGNGLAWVQMVKDTIRSKLKPDEHRKKGNRITVWLADDTYFRLLSLKTKDEYPTFQAFAEAAIVEKIEREKMKRQEIIEADEARLS